MRKKVRTQETTSYWKSMVDMITALLLVILLLLMYFVLNLLVRKDEEYRFEHDSAGYDYNDHDSYGGYTNETIVTVTPTPSPTPTPTPVPDNYGGGGGAGGGHEHDYDHEFDEPIDEGGDKAAVYAKLIDEESGQIIKIPEVKFELYSSAGTRLTLSTHYPEKVSYTQFETTQEGGFYLPEKIPYGEYYLHQLTEVPGYDFSADTVFYIDEAYDWGSAYEVDILLGAAKNNIQIQVIDSITYEPLQGVVFDVVADGDVTTPDGTVRYSDHSVADTIECDDEGYGLSDELYLGDFVLVPKNLPFGYASPDSELLSITVTPRVAAGEYMPMLTLPCDVTTVHMSVVDELYTDTVVAGAEYTLSASDGGEGDRTFTVGESGKFDITDLRKGVTYNIKQTSIVGDYEADPNTYTFTVDGHGRIDDETSLDIDVTCRMIRTEITVIDRVTKSDISDCVVTILDQDGNVVDSWIADGTPHKIYGLDTGNYTLEVEDSSDRTIIIVEDTAEVQQFSARVMTGKGRVLLYSLIGLITALVLAVLALMLPKWLKKNKEDKKKKGA